MADWSAVRRLRPSGVLWHDGDFLRFWSAQTISQFGSQVSSLALPFVAIYVLKATAFQIAALSAVEFLPFVVLTLPAGVWVDRLRRRPLMIAADWGRAAALGSVPIAYAFDALTLGQLYAVGFIAGCLTVFFDISYQSYLPSLVSREHLGEGNTKLETSRAAAQVTGPGLAGLLVSAVTAPYAVAVDAISFVASAVLATAIRRREPVEPKQLDARPRMRTEIMTGLRYTLRHPLLRPLIFQIGIQNFFINMVGALLVVYAVRELHLSAVSVGLVFSLGNLGLLLGAPMAGSLARRFGIGPVLVWGGFVTGASYLLVAAAPSGFPIPFLVAAQFLWSAGAILYFVNGISLIQTITPDRLLGRVNASRRFAVWGVIPVGQLIAGVIAAKAGLHTDLDRRDRRSPLDHPTAHVADAQRQDHRRGPGLSLPPQRALRLRQHAVASPTSADGSSTTAPHAADPGRSSRPGRPHTYHHWESTNQVKDARSGESPPPRAANLVAVSSGLACREAAPCG